jgi:UDP-N-acetylmuramate--alanine ligase
MQHADWMSVDLRALARTGPVHFMGVAGAGMSALADLLAHEGGSVTGCDLRPSAAGESLRARGTPIHKGHDAAHVVDAVALVVTSAIPSTHPELVAARESGIPVLKRAQALGSIVNRGTVIAIAGTHGKTTTTAAATAILDSAGIDPTGLVGGRMPAWGGGLRPGASNVFVVEADEYDRSFMTLQPTAAVVTSVEADHLDIYGDLAGVENAFAEFLAQVHEDGLVAVCADDAGAARAGAAVRERRVLTYGIGAEADLRATDIRQDGRTMRFTVVEAGHTLGELTLGAPGLHNIRNALGAFAAARHVGASFGAAQQALPSFTGVARRFQELGSPAGITVVDDYAHHPTELDATLATARGAYPGRRIIAAFQPHLYSRTKEHAAGFGRALTAADVVWVSDIYPAREAPIEGVTGALVADAAREAGADVVNYAVTLDELHRELRNTLREGDVLVAMGAGDIGDMAHEIFRSLGGGDS